MLKVNNKNTRTTLTDLRDFQTTDHKYLTLLQDLCSPSQMLSTKESGRKKLKGRTLSTLFCCNVLGVWVIHKEALVQLTDIFTKESFCMNFESFICFQLSGSHSPICKSFFLSNRHSPILNSLVT